MILASIARLDRLSINPSSSDLNHFQVSRILSSFLIVLALIAPARWASAAKLRIGYSAITPTMTPLWNAHEKGFFAKYGFEAELIYLAGGSRIALALEADSIQLAQLNLNAGIEARLAGGSVTIAQSIIGKYSRISDREVLQESYRSSIPHIPTRPYVNREIVARALKMSRRDAARRAEPEHFYDNGFVKELDDSGFISALFGKR